MPASDAIVRRGSTIVLNRESTPGEHVDGIWVEGAASSVEALGLIQPLSGKERALLPEGIRDTGKWRVWGMSEIKTNDTLTIEGTPCVILSSERWTDHWRAIAGDVDGGT